MGTLALSYAATGQKKEAENLHKLMDHRLQKVAPKELKGIYSEVDKLAKELRHELPGYKASRHFRHLRPIFILRPKHIFNIISYTA